MSENRRVTIVLDRQTYEEVEDLARRLGFLKKSEVYRYIIKKGVDVVKREVRGGV